METPAVRRQAVQDGRLRLGKDGQPEEIATAALFLASEDSSFVNGVDLAVDGGFSAI